MTLTRRTQVLLDDDRYDAVRRRAVAEGTSVGAVIREAIDRAIGDEADARSARVRAGASFLAAEPMEVEDWDVIEEEIATAFAKDADLGGRARPQR